MDLSLLALAAAMGLGLLALAVVGMFVYDIYDRIKFKKFMKENLPKWNPKDNDTKPQ
jgi:hypothetical protein